MIRRIQILNYRCFRHVDISLDKFHILVGPNASGKTSFMDSIAILGDILNSGLEDSILQFEAKNGNRGRASKIDELFFNYSSDQFQIAIQLDIPQELKEKNTHYESARYEISVGKEKTGELRIFHEVLFLCPESVQRKTPQKQLESQHTLFPLIGEVPADIFIRRVEGMKEVVKRSETGRSYYRDEKIDWNSPFRIGHNKSALANLPEDRDKFPIAIWVKEFLMEGINVLTLNSHFMRKPASPSMPRKFKMDGSNISLVIEQLEREDRDKFAQWIEHLQTVLPELETIKSIKRPEDNHVYFSIKYSNISNPIPAWLLSDGTLRLLALTILAYLPEQKGIYLIEEPENGIHPKALEAVFQSLSSIYSGQVLLATHSPLLLTLSDLRQILCFAKDIDTGSADIVHGNNHPNLRDWKGEIDIGTLYAAGVLG